MMRDGEPGAACLRSLHAMAARRAFTPDEADDLVQDVLLAALEQGRTLDDPRFPAWASGVLRRRALFLARTAGRRRRREADYAADSAPLPAPDRTLPLPFVESLPPSLQVVALLANAGLGRAEIGSLLRISDTALRQRISGLRRAWKRAEMVPELAPRVIQPMSSGPRRRALKTSLEKLPGAHLAVADPDGHPIFLTAPAHNRRGRGN
jgi:DNA-directed RNA polymerase specialized sigma24 family protein